MFKIIIPILLKGKFSYNSSLSKTGNKFHPSLVTILVRFSFSQGLNLLGHNWRFIRCDGSWEDISIELVVKGLWGGN